MIIQFYRNLYSGFINTEISLDEILNAIKNPKTNFHVREDIPLWSFYIPVAQDDLSKNEKGEPRGCSDNMRSVHAFQIDFDSNIMTIEKFCEQYKKFEFYLYTSFSHKPDYHKFRVILPLNGAHSNLLMKVPENCKIFSDAFPGCDISTINSFRKQRIPAVNPEHPEYYRFVINNGKKWDIDFRQAVANYDKMINRNQERVMSRSTVTSDESDMPEEYYHIEGLYVPRQLNVKECTELACRKAISVLPWGTRGTGIIHATLCTWFGKMTTAGFDAMDIMDIFDEYAPTSMRQELLGICRM